MARKSRLSLSIRELVKEVRLNLATVVVLMVTISVLALGLLLLVENSSTNTAVTVDNLRDVIAQEDPTLQRFITTTDGTQEIVKIINVVQRNYQQNTQEALQFYTPLVVLASGVVAYFIARQLVKPVQETYRSQERFIQDAAHELRNPLAAMKVTIQSAKIKQKLTGKDAERILGSMSRQVDQLININENLLFLDRVSDTQKLELVNVSELLHDVLEDQQSLAQQKGIGFRVKIEPDLLHPIRSDDFVRLSRNLLENAVKYSTEGSDDVRISLQKKGQRLRLSIRDFGIGIPESEQHRIGRRFYRASNTSAHDGTGLGMAIVQKIARTYSGTVTINSTYGEGTHIVVNL